MRPIAFPCSAQLSKTGPPEKPTPADWQESLMVSPSSLIYPEGIVRLTAEDVIRPFVWHNRFMPSPSLYHRHRFPAEIISHCVWLYFRFSLSLRDVEEMLAMRGVSLSYETV